MYMPLTCILMLLLVFCLTKYLYVVYVTYQWNPIGSKISWDTMIIFITDPMASKIHPKIMK